MTTHMTQPETPAALAARVGFLIKQLRLEAILHADRAAYRLLDQERARLAAAYRSAYSPDPEVRAAVTQHLEAAIDLLVEAASARAERMLAERNTP